MTFNQQDIAFLAQCFAEVIQRERYTCYACALMPDHVHILIRKHKHLAEVMIANLQDHSRERVIDAGLRPASHPVWGGPGWKVFLDTTDAIRRTIRYIEMNPVKIGWAAQGWPFVVEYDNWPFHKRPRK